MLHEEVAELQRQIKLHEERARQHAAELLRVKEAAAKEAREAKLREANLLRQVKELEDKLAQITREFKAKVADLEKQVAEASKKLQVPRGPLVLDPLVHDALVDTGFFRCCLLGSRFVDWHVFGGACSCVCGRACT